MLDDPCFMIIRRGIWNTVPYLGNTTTASNSSGPLARTKRTWADLLTTIILYRL